jgi:urocanate hydratase
LPFDPAPSPSYSFLRETYLLYLSIIPSKGAVSNSEEESGLGGKLLYAGELDQEGRALMIAGNIAGAASLSGSADLTAQKQAVRDGVADFLVNTLEEALRILKNEIRKRNAVAVCVAATPTTIESEMLERGVKPDLHRDSLVVPEMEPIENRQLVSWCVGSAPARWLPKVDAIAMACIAPEAEFDRRWLRLSPRYLGRMAQGIRILSGDAEFADQFAERVRKSVRSGEIGAEVWIQVVGDRLSNEHRILPEVQ